MPEPFLRLDGVNAFVKACIGEITHSGGGHDRVILVSRVAARLYIARHLACEYRFQTTWPFSMALHLAAAPGQLAPGFPLDEIEHFAATLGGKYTQHMTELLGWISEVRACKSVAEWPEDRPTVAFSCEPYVGFSGPAQISAQAHLFNAGAGLCPRATLDFGMDHLHKIMCDAREGLAWSLSNEEGLKGQVTVHLVELISAPDEAVARVKFRRVTEGSVEDRRDA